MKRAVVGLVLAVVVAGWCIPGEAWGQYGPFGRGAMMAGGEGAIAGNGNVTVKRPPTQLRMFLMLSGKGKTIEDAIADLKAKREKAVAHVEKLGADKKSIDRGTATVSQEDARRRRELEQMIRQRMRGGKATKAAKLPETVTVAAMLSAHWPLEAKDPETILLFVYKLQKDIKDAKLASGDEKGLSAEEAELAEEAGAEGADPFSGRFGEEQGDPNTPMFAYVAMISEADRAKAMGEAFQKAKADAVRLAAAAGVQLGPLAGVAGGTVGNTRIDFSNRYGGSNPMQELMMRQMGDPEEGENRENEAVGQDPAHVTFVVNVTATFALASGKPAEAKPAAEK
jgi:hypothetical protein